MNTGKIFQLALGLCLLLSGTAIAQETKKIDREKFSLQYPATWAIATEDEDYDPDALFSIDAPDEENFVMFFFFDMEIDADEMIDLQVEAFTAELLKNPTNTSFTSWGGLKGKGAHLKGEFLGMFPGNIRIFVHATENRSMLVVEQYYDTNADEIRKKLKVISDSFAFKNPIN